MGNTTMLFLKEYLIVKDIVVDKGWIQSFLLTLF